MNKISAIILTKNSEDIIADCIDSVSFCDEVIAIDDSSVDRTVELSKHLGAKVYECKSKDFSEKRNLGLKKAKYRWILYVDSDERVSSELKKSIIDILRKNKDVASGYQLIRKNFYYGNHEWPTTEKMGRLFQKNKLEKWIGKIHETPVVNGELVDLDGFLNHYTHQDLGKMVDKTNEWSKFEAESRYTSKHPKMKTWRFFRVMATAFYDSYIRQKGYKAGTAGLVESIYQSFSIFITYAKLWEMQNSRK